jgi:hypothetical protein
MYFLERKKCQAYHAENNYVRDSSLCICPLYVTSTV